MLDYIFIGFLIGSLIIIIYKTEKYFYDKRTYIYIYTNRYSNLRLKKGDIFYIEKRNLVIEMTYFKVVINNKTNIEFSICFDSLCERDKFFTELSTILDSKSKNKIQNFNDIIKI